MGYTTRSKDDPLDVGRATDQNESVDNDTFLYNNLRTEIEAYAAHRPSASVSAYSDEFNETSLDADWTAYTFGAGTVAEWETGAVDKYDLSSFPGWMAYQTDASGNNFDMTDGGIRKAFAPGTGPWAVHARLSLFNRFNTSGTQFIGVGISDNTTPTNYNLIKVGWDNGAAPKVLSYNNGGLLDSNTVEGFDSFYVAITRQSAGGDTYFWASTDGLTWLRSGNTATAISVAYLWLFVHQSGAPTLRPIYLADYVRTFATATLICGRAGNS